jgi:hypothetical protein
LRRRTQRLWRGSAKGIDAQIDAFLGAVNGHSTVDRASYLESSTWVIEIAERLAEVLRQSAAG